MTLAAEATMAVPSALPGRGQIAQRPKLWAFAILLLICGAVCIRTASVSVSSTGAIDVESFDVARDMLHAARSDALSSAPATHDRMPGYALLVAAVALADPHVEQGLACSSADRTQCSAKLFRSMFVLQGAAAVAFFAILLAIAWRLCRTWQIVTLTMLLAFIAMRPGDFAGLVRPIIWYQLLFALFVLLALLAHQARSLSWAAGAGAVLGLAALFEPAAAVLAPVGALVLARHCERDCSVTVRMALGIAFLGGGLAVALGGLGLASNYLAYDANGGLRHVLRQLAEHLSYSALDFKTWALSLVVPIPLLGDWIALAIPQSAAQLSVGRLGSGATESMARLFNEGMTRGGSTSGAIGWLLANRVAGDFGGYLWALPALVARGIWAGGGIVALFGLFHMRTLVAHARADKADGDLLVVLVPVLALFVVNTLLTANTYWLNPLLPFLYSYAIAYVAAGW